MEINSPFTSAHAFSRHPEVIGCFRLNTYINTMGLAAFSNNHTREKTRTGSHLPRGYSGVLRMLTQDVWGETTEKACAVPPPTTQAYKTALWPTVHVADRCNSTSGKATFAILSLSGQTEKTHFWVFQGNTPKWRVSFWLHGGDSATRILPGNYLISVCLSHSSFLPFFSAFIHLV